jgi:hypothetical protein
MFTFKQFILEESSFSIPWERPNHGWLGDFKHLPDDHEVTLYHGTTDDKAESIMKSGLTIPDKRTGFVSTTPDPNTSHGYASMGGEANFRRAGELARHVPHEERAIVKIKTTAGWLRNNVDPNLRGNIGVAADTLTNKDKYDSWRKENPKTPDHVYYQMSEYRIPPVSIDNPNVKFVGIMKKPLKKSK